MSKDLNIKKAKLFKALANPVRLEIIDLLSDGEKCVCEIQQALNKYGQPHISKSLAKLKSVGLIKDRRDGTNVYYSLAICCMGEFSACLNKVINQND